MSSTRTGALLIAAAVVLTSVSTTTAPVAVADTVPTAAGLPSTVSADALPTAQVDGVVWDQVIVGDVVYAVGEFTVARPAGAAPGEQTTPRGNALAYRLSTGQLLPGWAPTLNAQGRTVAAADDGSVIYVGGDFTQVNGATRNRLVALDPVTGAVVTGFKGSTNGPVRTIAVSGGTVYAGGSFTSARGLARTRLAAYDARTGEVLTGWAPSADAVVLAMTVPPGSGRVVVGGKFGTLNGTTMRGSGALDATTGQTLPWAVQAKVNDWGSKAAITDLTSDAGTVWGSGYNFGGNGNLENVFAATVGGALLWANGCKGDTYGVHQMGGVLYAVSHTHNCDAIGGMPEQNPRAWQRAVAFTAAAAPNGRKNTSGPYSGTPAAEPLGWLPTLTAGVYTGQTQAAWTVTGNGRYLVIGGEFTAVNGTRQQGLVRLAIRELAPNVQGPVTADGLTPSLASSTPGLVTATFTASWDRDTPELTYELLRGPNATTAVVVDRARRTGAWYLRPAITLADRSAAQGSSQTYRIRALDSYGNAVTGDEATVTVAAGTVVAPYPAAVTADAPRYHWRLGEAAGTTAADATGVRSLSLRAGAVRGVAGPLTGDPDTATTFGSGGSYNASTRTSETAPTAYTLETWFRTGSTTGGKLVGFGNQSLTASTRSDRHVYLTGGGAVVLGQLTPTGQVATVRSAEGYNDGGWHHVAATFSPATGLRLYLDGALAAADTDVTGSFAYTGYWRVAGDAFGTGGAATWPSVPTTTQFAGTLDEVAFYRSALPAAAIAGHRASGLTGRRVAAPAPWISYTAGYTTVALDGSRSFDLDGAIASYAWDFGDGTTGSGATPSHTYPASGSYPVTLTVTDDAGLAASTTVRVVTTVSTDTPPTAQFGTRTDGLLVAFDASGSRDRGGAIASYAWDFGDGTTGTGATPSHTYPASGSYPVTLTVTDDTGSTGQAGGTVVVSAPTTLAADDFDRAVTAGWGTATVGGGWSATAGASALSVDSSAAVLALAAAKRATVVLPGVSAADVDLRVEQRLPAMPTGTGVYVSALLRSGAAGDYRVRVRYQPDGVVRAGVFLGSAGTETAIRAEALVPGITYTAGTVLRLRAQAFGSAPTTIRYRLWVDGTAEPTGWTSVTDDTTGLQGAGAVGFSGYATSSSTGTTRLRLDQLSVRLL